VCGVSPQSRGRKRKSSGKRGPNRPPELEEVIASAAQGAFRELEQITDPLQAELYVSELLGTWWGQFLVDADPEVLVGERLVAHVAKQRRAGALGLLRLLAILGTDVQRAQAAAGADALAAAGVSAPAWVAALHTERVTEAWAYGDVYGDQTSVLLVVERGGAQHGVVVLVDHTLDGIAKDAFVTDEPHAVPAEIRGFADPTIEVRQLPTAAAAGLLVPAFAATDAAPAPPVDEDFRVFRALALARVRLLPAALPAVAPAVPDAATQEAIVQKFLSSADARGLPPAADRCAALLVAFGCHVDPARPLRVGPALIDRFLDETVNGEPEPPDDVFDALPATVRAWASWAGRRAELPPEAADELRESVDDMLAHLEEPADAEMIGADVVDRYLAGIDLDEVSPEALPDIIQRRTFAMPYTGTRIGNGEFAHLDPSDLDDRCMLIEGEHPEYHAALSDTHPETVDGVNPRPHITLHEVVANQLWDDDPPEAWQAATRLLAEGMDRHDVLHAIAEVLTTHLHGLLTGSAATPDLEAYLAGLDALGRRASGEYASVTPLRPKR
jgi:hypothetical protein